MLGIDDQVGAEEHPPEAYRKLVSGSPITRAAALTIAPAGDMDRTRHATTRCCEPELQAILHDNAASLLSQPAGE
jgi:hypothetical protein